MLYRLILPVILTLFIIGCDSKNESSIPSPNEYISTGYYEGEYYPTSEWRSCMPEEVDMNADKIVEAIDYIQEHSPFVRSAIIIRKGYIVAEAYWNNLNRHSYHDSYSVAKSFVSTLIGIAIEQGHIKNVDEKVYQYFDEWQKNGTDPTKKEIKIKHLLEMTGGISWNEDDYTDNNNDVYVMSNYADFIGYVLNKRMKNYPGTVWYYSSGESMLLSGVIEAATEKNTFTYAQQNLLGHIGITDINWQRDQVGHTIGGWGIQTTTRNYARLGYLFLKKGLWDETQVVPEQWVTTATTSKPKALHYGYQWWVARGLAGYPDSDVPQGTFLAIGLYGQFVVVIPELEIIIAINCDQGERNDWSTITMIDNVVDAVND